MSYYPLATLMLAGIRDIRIISTPTDTPRFEDMLGDGSNFCMHLSYAVQPSTDGWAQAFIIGKGVAGDNECAIAGNLSTLAPVMENPNFRFAKLDICDREGVYKLFAEALPGMVVNFAKESYVDRSNENPEVFLQTNILGNQVPVDACREYGITRYHQFRGRC